MISPLGVVVTNIGGVILGWATGQLLVFRWAGFILFIPWMWFITHDPWHVAYILFVNLIYWTSMLPELGQFFALLRPATTPPRRRSTLSWAWVVAGSLYGSLRSAGFDWPAAWKINS